MLFVYPFIIAFTLIFMSELGDKTQLIALSFSYKLKTSTILFGVALGTLFSHGIAIFFGSLLGNIANDTFQITIKLITYLSFIIFGIISLKSTNNNIQTFNSNNKMLKTNLYYIFFIAFSIAIGEFGDKTSLASIGLGIQYSHYKLILILAAILAMVASDLIAIVFGKLLSKRIPESIIKKFSAILFLIFGFWGIITHFLLSDKLI